MNGPEFTIQKLLEATKKEQPKSLVIGSHHYVQIAEMDLNTTGVQSQDLSSVFWVMPVGTSVPEGLFAKIQKKYPNMVVSCAYTLFLKFELFNKNVQNKINWTSFTF